LDQPGAVGPRGDPTWLRVRSAGLALSLGMQWSGRLRVVR
jgi:hypothetical protein